MRVRGECKRQARQGKAQERPGTITIQKLVESFFWRWMMGLDDRWLCLKPNNNYWKQVGGAQPAPDEGRGE